MPSRTPKTTTQKRLGYDHQVQRARLLTLHTDGTPCWWCGRPMFKDRRKNFDYDAHARRKDGKPDTSSGSLSAEHSNPRSKSSTSIADKLLHGQCNKERGDGTRDDQRPALTYQPQDDQLGHRIFDWP